MLYKIKPHQTSHIKTVFGVMKLGQKNKKICSFRIFETYSIITSKKGLIWTIRRQRSKTDTLLEPAGKNLMVGNDCTLISSTSFAVASIFATTIVSWSLYFSPNLSHVGISCLQCPHQGASAGNYQSCREWKLEFGSNKRAKLILRTHVKRTWQVTIQFEKLECFD